MTSYYDGPDIEELVLGALRASGRSLDPLDPDDLAGLDEFHALGRAGTLALANLAEVRRGAARPRRRGGDRRPQPGARPPLRGHRDRT